jgi:hypothetical protein
MEPAASSLLAPATEVQDQQHHQQHLIMRSSHDDDDDDDCEQHQLQPPPPPLLPDEDAEVLEVMAQLELQGEHSFSSSSSSFPCASPLAAATAAADDQGISPSTSLYAELLKFHNETNISEDDVIASAAAATLQSAVHRPSNNDVNNEDDYEEDDDRKPAARPPTTTTRLEPQRISSSSSAVDAAAAAKKKKGGKLRQPIARDYFAKKQLEQSSSLSPLSSPSPSVSCTRRRSSTTSTSSHSTPSEASRTPPAATMITRAWSLPSTASKHDFVVGAGGGGITPDSCSRASSWGTTSTVPMSSSSFSNNASPVSFWSSPGKSSTSHYPSISALPEWPSDDDVSQLLTSPVAASVLLPRDHSRQQRSLEESVKITSVEDDNSATTDEALARMLQQQEEEEALTRRKSQTEIDALVALQIQAVLQSDEESATATTTSSITTKQHQQLPHHSTQTKVMSASAATITTATTTGRSSSSGSISQDEVLEQERILQEIINQKREREELELALAVSVSESSSNSRIVVAVSAAAAAAAKNNAIARFGVAGNNHSCHHGNAVEATRSVAIHSSSSALAAVPGLRMSGSNNPHHRHDLQHFKGQQQQQQPFAERPLGISPWEKAGIVVAVPDILRQHQQQQHGRDQGRPESDDLERALAESAALAAAKKTSETTATGRRNRWNSPSPNILTVAAYDNGGSSSSMKNRRHSTSSHHDDDRLTGRQDEEHARDWHSTATGSGGNTVVQPDYNTKNKPSSRPSVAALLEEELLRESPSLHRTESTSCSALMTPDWKVSQQRALEEFELRMSGTEPSSSSSSAAAAAVSLPHHSPRRNGGRPNTEEEMERRDMLRRGQDATVAAVRMGRFHIVQCRGCQGQLQAPVHSSLVYCPACGHVSPGQAV